VPTAAFPVASHCRLPSLARHLFPSYIPQDVPFILAAFHKTLREVFPSLFTFVLLYLGNDCVYRIITEYFRDTGKANLAVYRLSPGTTRTAHVVQVKEEKILKVLSRPVASDDFKLLANWSEAIKFFGIHALVPLVPGWLVCILCRMILSDEAVSTLGRSSGWLAFSFCSRVLNHVASVIGSREIANTNVVLDRMLSHGDSLI
jgi:hypothetical protein